jgi:cell division protein ZapA
MIYVMGDEKFLLTLTIDGKNLPPLKINRSDEEAFRAAAKQINTKINQHRAKFENSSDLGTWDIMAMITVQALAKNYSLEDKNNTKPFEDKIHSLIGELDDYLKK